MTDLDPNLLKSAAAYLVQVARSSKGGRFRKSAKIEALRECKEEILEVHHRGISIHRIAQIFRERKVDISTQHLMRAIRLFIAEEERGGGKASAAKEGRQGPAAAGEEKKRSVTYEPLEQISPVVREEEFAKQLRLARYLARASLPAARTLEPPAQPRTPKPARAVSKARTSTKKETPRQKAAEAELARAGGLLRRRRAWGEGLVKSESERPALSKRKRVEWVRG